MIEYDISPVTGGGVYQKPMNDKQELQLEQQRTLLLKAFQTVDELQRLHSQMFMSCRKDGYRVAR